MWLGIGVMGLLAGCAGEEEAAEPEPTRSAPRLVGRVASLHAGEGFALIESYGDWRLGEGLLLSSVGDEGQTGTLVTSGERLGRYHAADLKAGRVGVGDLIYSRPRSEEALDSPVWQRPVDEGNPEEDPEGESADEP